MVLFAFCKQEHAMLYDLCFLSEKMAIMISYKIKNYEIWQTLKG